jgi:hypothetical protein
VGELEVERELRALAGHYAMSVDEGDADGFADTFLPEARLQVFRPGDGDVPSTDLTGHDALRAIPPRLGRTYDQTFHFLGQSSYSIGASEGEATGRVYCQAHHLRRPAAGGSDFVMFIRYDDTYRRNPAGAWKFADRVVRVRWTETRAVDAIEAAA